MNDYAEIGLTTNFSFLRGGSHPQDYVHQASELRLAAIGIADHNTLAGIVRAYSELENPEVKHKPNLLVGAASSSSTARLTFWSIHATAPPTAGSAGCSPAASVAATPKKSRRASAS